MLLYQTCEILSIFFDKSSKQQTLCDGIIAMKSLYYKSPHYFEFKIGQTILRNVSLLSDSGEALSKNVTLWILHLGRRDRQVILPIVAGIN